MFLFFFRCIVLTSLQISEVEDYYKNLSGEVPSRSSIAGSREGPSLSSIAGSKEAFAWRECADFGRREVFQGLSPERRGAGIRPKRLEEAEREKEEKARAERQAKENRALERKAEERRLAEERRKEVARVTVGRQQEELEQPHPNSERRLAIQGQPQAERRVSQVPFPSDIEQPDPEAGCRCIIM